MVYASREATKKAIRAMLKKESSSKNLEKLPKRSGKEGISAKNFRNANGAELIYK